MAKEEKTQVKEPEKETPDEDSYEKRYKDSQSHITKIEKENADLRTESTKDKELFDTVSPYINWDSINNPDAKAATDDDTGYVDKKTLNQKIKDLQDQMKRDRLTVSFRSKYPDMVPYEDLVGAFLNKTDPRRSIEERMEKAVESTRKLLESERVKGREEFEKEKKEKSAKEAEASGLGAGKGPKGEEKDPEGETFNEYINARKAQVRKAMGISEQV